MMSSKMRDELNMNSWQREALHNPLRAVELVIILEALLAYLPHPLCESGDVKPVIAHVEQLIDDVIGDK